MNYVLAPSTQTSRSLAAEGGEQSSADSELDGQLVIQLDRLTTKPLKLHSHHSLIDSDSHTLALFVSLGTIASSLHPSSARVFVYIPHNPVK